MQAAIGDAWLASSYDQAVRASAATDVPVVTLGGDVCRFGQLVSGGGREEVRGILSTKREIKELRERAGGIREQLARLADQTALVEESIARLTGAIADLTARAHGHEKAIVGFEANLAKTAENLDRLERKAEVLATESARAEEQRRSLAAREAEAREAASRREADRQAAQEGFDEAQRQLLAAREAVEVLGRRAADARAAHAALVERATALLADVARQEEALADLESRFAAREEEARQNQERRGQLRQAIEEGRRQLDVDGQELEAARVRVREADEALTALRESSDAEENAIRRARQVVDELRGEVGELEVARATAESDLAHLASVCQEAVQESLDAVLAEVEQAEREGQEAPGAAMPEEPEEDAGDEEGEGAGAAVAAGAGGLETQEAPLPPLVAVAEAAAKAAPATPEDAIADLKAKIDRLGPVNMMAIEQFDELEQRHGFLTVQRKDLRDSIAATGEAIKRIDETSKERFREAFAVINRNFQETFTILFGGGRAGLTLLDETDVLESGIEIVAQPPGKRLQSVQLLSGGEKALTAIALMFGIFRYKPSPFCVLDEIDAPLDDANIGRFVEILKQMQEHTQFIIITHSRKTMEIADRLYGVTMEEPGVSKLISVKLN